MKKRLLALVLAGAFTLQDALESTSYRRGQKGHRQEKIWKKYRLRIQKKLYLILWTGVTVPKNKERS